MEREPSTTLATFADILAQVVENGRLKFGTVEELEVEVDFEAREQGLSKETARAAVEYAKKHYKF